MKIIEIPQGLLYFGSHKDGIKIKNGLKESPDAFLNLKRIVNAQSLVFLNQVHGIDGVVIGDDYKIAVPVTFLTESGDILITHRSRIGLGILTGDCLPIIVIDQKGPYSAAIHAGWRGTLQSVVTHAVEMMRQRFKSKLSDLVIYFGPSARPCCYEVGPDFLAQLKGRDQQECVISREGKKYFDIPGLNILQLKSLGIKSDKIILDNNECTVCHHEYCSVRREGSAAGRQATIVVLR